MHRSIERYEDTGIKCRLCDQIAQFRFRSLLLNRYDVAYYECKFCHSLQTEAPYWLDEAYTVQAEQFDTGKASRTLDNFFALPSLLNALGITQNAICLDWGGGTGLLARLMRDIGYNYYSSDLYSQGEYIQGFPWTGRQTRKLRVITSFEVVEHFQHPLEEWRKILCLDPDVLIISTGLYHGQGSDWFYLSPENGQHIFFYSEFALAWIANQNSYFVYRVGTYFIFCKEAVDAELSMRLEQSISNRTMGQRQIFEHWLAQPYRYAAQDHALLQRQLAGHTLNIILIDMVFLQRYRTGIARVWESLLRRWVKTDFNKSLIILDRARTAPRLDGLRYLDIVAHDYGNIARDRALIQDVCDEYGASLFISTYYTSPLRTPAVLLVHDMIPEVLGWDLTHPMWLEKKQAIDYADHYIAVSENTATDLARFFPRIKREEITVIHNGCDFVTPTDNQITSFRIKYGLNRPYFILSGLGSGYKNAELFFRALEILGSERDNLSVLCTGGTPVNPEFIHLAGGATIYTFRFDDTELQCAYAGALALVYPSVYEGFGMPPIEAMACSCPVITCPCGALPEICDDAVIYVNPNDVKGMSNALSRIQQPTVCSELIRRGLNRSSKYSWDTMADSMAAELSYWSNTI